MLRLRSHEKYEITSTTLTQKEFIETQKVQKQVNSTATSEPLKTCILYSRGTRRKNCMSCYFTGMQFMPINCRSELKFANFSGGSLPSGWTQEGNWCEVCIQYCSIGPVEYPVNGKTLNKIYTLRCGYGNESWTHGDVVL